MIIIFGWTTKGVTLRPLIDTYCYPCQRVATWEWYRLGEWMTLFFLPVLPVRSEYYLVCRGCRDNLKLTADEVKEIKRLPELAPDESQALHDGLVKRLEGHQLAGKTETQREFLRRRNR